MMADLTRKLQRRRKHRALTRNLRRELRKPAGARWNLEALQRGALRRPGLGAIVAISFALLAVTLALKWAPEWLASTDGLSGSARAEEIGRTRTAVLAVFAGLLATVGAVYTARAFALNRRGHELNREGQITERFTRAIDQLGSDRAIEVRLGSIYALERIARESKRDHGPIMEILSAYVREHAPLSPDAATTHDANGPAAKTASSKTVSTAPRPRMATDVQAALTVIARRHIEHEDEDEGEDISLDLSFVDIPGAHMPKAKLERVRFEGSNLEGANLESARLADANFLDASLAHSNLAGAYLQRANLLDANLTHADLEEAILESATLVGADLSYANLDLTELSDANMFEAVVTGAKFRKTVLVRANIGDVDFSRARIDRAVFFEARYLDGTVWPPGVDPEEQDAIKRP